MTAATTEQLQQQVAAIDADLARLDDDYNALISKLASGDRTVIARADALEQKRNALFRSKAMNIAACGVLQQEQEKERQQAEAAAKREQLREARRLADAVMAANTAIDQPLVELRERFTARSNALRALASTGQCDQTFVNKLLGKAPPT
jgi:hypothetical protein